MTVGEFAAFLVSARDEVTPAIWMDESTEQRKSNIHFILAARPFSSDAAGVVNSSLVWVETKNGHRYWSFIYERLSHTRRSIVTEKFYL